MYGKGYLISDDQGYRAQKVKTFTTGAGTLEPAARCANRKGESERRRSLNQTPGVPVGFFQDVWFWYPAFGSFIYMPDYRYRSPYGYSYQNVTPVYSGGGGLWRSAQFESKRG